MVWHEKGNGREFLNLKCKWHFGSSFGDLRLTGTRSKRDQLCLRLGLGGTRSSEGANLERPELQTLCFRTSPEGGTRVEDLHRRPCQRVEKRVRFQRKFEGEEKLELNLRRARAAV